MANATFDLTQTVRKPQLTKVKDSDAASRWAEWALLTHLEFGSSVNLITTRGADCAHHITASPPGFENPVASLKDDIVIQDEDLHDFMNKIAGKLPNVQKRQELGMNLEPGTRNHFRLHVVQLTPLVAP